MWKGEESIKKSILQNLHVDITVRTQCDKVKMKSKVS